MKSGIFSISTALILPFVFFTQTSLRHSASTQLDEPYQDIEVKMYPLTESGGIDTTDPEHPLC